MNLRVFAFSWVSAASLAACSTTGSYGAVNEDVVYLKPMAPRMLDRDYVDRYACPNHVPLECDCFSRLSRSCLCTC
jgi:hypothetical protein